jgi:hypothetical protein
MCTALCLDNFVIKCFRAAFKWIVLIKPLVVNDLAPILKELERRSKLILMRTQGMIRNSNLLLQLINPACCVAKKYPNLPISKFILSFFDADFSDRTFQSLIVEQSIFTYKFEYCITFLPFWIFDLALDTISATFVLILIYVFQILLLLNTILFSVLLFVLLLVLLKYFFGIRLVETKDRQKVYQQSSSSQSRTEDFDINYDKHKLGQKDKNIDFFPNDGNNIIVDFEEQYVNLKLKQKNVNLVRGSTQSNNMQVQRKFKGNHRQNRRHLANHPLFRVDDKIKSMGPGSRSKITDEKNSIKFDLNKLLVADSETPLPAIDVLAKLDFKSKIRYERGPGDSFINDDYEAREEESKFAKGSNLSKLLSRPR